MDKKLLIKIAALFTFLIAGCTNHQESRKSELALIKTSRPAPIELSNRPPNRSIGYQVREQINKIDGIYDVAVIEGKKDVIVAYKVNHLHRFKMKKIEKELTKKLDNEFPEDKFIVSSDYKIFLEAIRLKEDLEQKNLSNEEAEKRFRKIIKLKKEMT
ncbi:sporulation protein [Lederbergia citrea]|uniref:sporulation protein n=1 Tax=Lederbergia citrea TaxID=2833581 RepID=UPI001BC9739C|nr:sporulation protein [Lederbergia citrea]MBS4177383.1 sporulation protein [Lederbergia citrea]